MSLWAQPAELFELGDTLGIHVVNSTQAEMLLEQAQRDIEVHAIGARIAPVTFVLLTADQRAALGRAAVRQALWIHSREDERLGPSGLASVPGVTFSRDTPPVLSAEARAEVSLMNLIVRSGTVEPEPDPELVEPPLP